MPVRKFHFNCPARGLSSAARFPSIRLHRRRRAPGGAGRAPGAHHYRYWPAGAACSARAIISRPAQMLQSPGPADCAPHLILHARLAPHSSDLAPGFASALRARPSRKFVAQRRTSESRSEGAARAINNIESAAGGPIRVAVARRWVVSNCCANQVGAPSDWWRRAPSASQVERETDVSKWDLFSCQIIGPRRAPAPGARGPSSPARNSPAPSHQHKLGPPQLGHLARAPRAARRAVT